MIGMMQCYCDGTAVIGMMQCYCDCTAEIGMMHCYCDGTAVIGMTHCYYDGTAGIGMMQCYSDGNAVISMMQCYCGDRHDAMLLRWYCSDRHGTFSTQIPRYLSHVHIHVVKKNLQAQGVSMLVSRFIKRIFWAQAVPNGPSNSIKHSNSVGLMCSGHQLAISIKRALPKSKTESYVFDWSAFL